MTPADLLAFQKRQGWTRSRLGSELDISQNRLRRLLSGSVAIPRHIALACAALAYGLPPMGQDGLPPMGNLMMLTAKEGR